MRRIRQQFRDDHPTVPGMHNNVADALPDIIRRRLRRPAASVDVHTGSLSAARACSK
jgi:hypothetical protein